MSVASQTARAMQLVIDQANTAAKSLITPVFNVAGYDGVDLTGVKDSTAGVQRALDDSGAADYTENMVFVPPGRLKITAPLQIPPFTKFFGAGKSLVRITQATAGVPVLGPKSANRGAGQLSRRIWIEGMTLTGGTYGIDGENFYESNIRDVESQSATVAGIRLFNNNSACYYHDLIDCNMHNTPIGLYLTATPGFETTTVRMHRGIISGVTTGIRLERSNGFFDAVSIEESINEHVYCDGTASDNRFFFMRLENQTHPDAKVFRFKNGSRRNVVMYPTIGGINSPGIADENVEPAYNVLMMAGLMGSDEGFHVSDNPASFLFLNVGAQSRNGYDGTPAKNGDMWRDDTFKTFRFQAAGATYLMGRNVGNMADIAAAPTMADFNALLARLRTANILV